jgi:uncharacterized DUF497 family protein
VKRIEWNEEKNRQLHQERGITFESIVIAIEDGYLLDVVDHPNQKDYNHQRIFVVDIDGYVVLVPFVEDNEKIFLKTAYLSRKFTRDYLTERGNDYAKK